MTKEKWMPIIGFPNYEISNLANIRNIKTNKPVKSWVSKTHGYCCTILMRNNTKTNFRLHRLVAFHFVRNLFPSINVTVNHIDGNKLNNIATNLEWCSQSVNQKHAYKLKLQVPIKGIANTRTRIKDINVIHTICKLIAEKKTNKEIESVVDLTAISSICSFIHRLKTKKVFKDVSDQYF
jgi:3,4-dihydroxy-2-butanone 4-phosphate synthase